MTKPMIKLAKDKTQAELEAEAGEAVAVMRMPNLKANIVLVLDDSGSMSGEYQEDHVQLIANRVLALAMTLDPDQKVDIFSINRGFVGTLDMSSFQGWVNRNCGPCGGTDCASVFQAVLKHVGGPINPTAGPFRPVHKNRVSGAFSGMLGAIRSWFSPALAPAPAVLPNVDTGTTVAQVKSVTPTLVLFITDGEITDQPRSYPVLATMSSSPVFFQFVGLGEDKDFSFLINLPINGIANSAFFHMPCPDEEPVEDRWVYEQLTKPFSVWVKQAKIQGLLG